MKLRRSIVFLPTSLALGMAMSPLHATPTPMEDDEFWQLVQIAKERAGVRVEARPAALQSLLMALPLAKIQAFQVRYEALMLDANDWSLWGAAYVMNGGCSDDGFKYFRDWLISEGKATFQAALANPESLVSQPVREYFELESFGYAAMRANGAKGGGELERGFHLELAPPKGKEWNEADLPVLFPKLAAKYQVK